MRLTLSGLSGSDGLGRRTGGGDAPWRPSRQATSTPCTPAAPTIGPSGSGSEPDGG